jgi:hypothetical protein
MERLVGSMKSERPASVALPPPPDALVAAPPDDVPWVPVALALLPVVLVPVVPMVRLLPVVPALPLELSDVDPPAAIDAVAASVEGSGELQAERTSAPSPSEMRIGVARVS